MHSDMKRFISILLIICTFNIYVNAQEGGKEGYPDLTFGAEWGYVATFWDYTHNNFFSAEGYRINEEKNSFGYVSNGELYLHAGYNIDEFWNLSVYAGYGGVNGNNKVIPISFRVTRCYGNDPLKDRWFSFADIGSGICIKKPVQEIVTGRFGGGYRLSLSRDTKLDILAGLKLAYVHSEVIHDRNPIPYKMINRNNTICGGFSISLALIL